MHTTTTTADEMLVAVHQFSTLVTDTVMKGGKEGVDCPVLSAVGNLAVVIEGPLAMLWHHASLASAMAVLTR